MELLDKLGIDGRLIVWQLVNFTVLLLILRKFAYRPVLDALKRRAETVERSARQAKEIEEKLKSARAEFERTVRDAETRATAIVGEASAAAKKLTDDALAEARAQTARTIAAGKALLDEEREKIVSDASKELGALVSLAVEKVLEDVAPKVDTDALVQKALKTLKV